MPNLIKRARKYRLQFSLLVAAILGLVIGIPLRYFSNIAEASNPGIQAGLAVGVTAQKTVKMPEDDQGNPIPAPLGADIIVCVGEEVVFWAKGAPVPGTYCWSADDGGTPNDPPHFWDPRLVDPNNVPANEDGFSIVRKIFSRPGFYVAKVVYKHAQCDPATGYMRVLVVDDTRKNSDDEYVPDPDGGPPWSESGVPPYDDGCDLELRVVPETPVNKNDDDDSDTEDRLEQPVLGEQDLQPIIVTGYAGQNGAAVTLAITAGGDKINNKIWMDGGKNAEAGPADLSWTIPANSGQSRMFFVEGFEESDLEEVKFKATLVCNGSGSGGGSGGSGSIPLCVIKPTTVVDTYSCTRARMSVSFSETTGWRYRRIGLNGLPLGTSPQTAKAETDEESEQTYVDALNMQLRHETSDIYVPMPQGDMALAVKRNYETSSEGAKSTFVGLAANTFGSMCWKSNVSSYLVFEQSMVRGGNMTNEEMRDSSSSSVSAVDENGDRRDFDWHTTTDCKHILLAQVSNDSPQEFYSTRIESIDENTYVMTRKYGTKVVFEKAYTMSTITVADPGDANTPPTEFVRMAGFFRMKSATDRYGNVVEYDYTNSPVVDLTGTNITTVPAGVIRKIVPSTITARSGSGASRSLGLTFHNGNGYVATVTDPRGNAWSYEYDAQQRLSRVINPENGVTEYDYTTLGSSVTLPAVLEDTNPACPLPGAPEKIITGSSTMLAAIRSNMIDGASTPVSTTVSMGGNTITVPVKEYRFEYVADPTVLKYYSSNRVFAADPSRSPVLSKIIQPDDSEVVIAFASTVSQEEGSVFNIPFNQMAGAVFVDKKPAIEGSPPSFPVAEIDWVIKGCRRWSVTDADGKSRGWWFRQPTLVRNPEPLDVRKTTGNCLQQFADLNLIPFEIHDESEEPEETPEEKEKRHKETFSGRIIWGVIHVSLPTEGELVTGTPAADIGAFEAAGFNAGAGMADAWVRDYSGNLWTYEYGDHYYSGSNGAHLPGANFKALLDNAEPDFAYNWRHKDPTRTNHPEYGVREYRYAQAFTENNAETAITKPGGRVMVWMKDGEDRETEYGIDEAGRVSAGVTPFSIGLRTSETVKEANGTVIKECEYDYTNATFKGFMTEKRVLGAVYNDGNLGTHVTRFTPDAYGNTASVTVDPGGLDITTSSTYDLNGNKISSTDANGNVTTFVYDKLNRLVEVRYPDTGQGIATKKMGYDPNGNKLWEQDENGNYNHNRYDTFGRTVVSARDMDANGLINGYNEADHTGQAAAVDGPDIVSFTEYNPVGSVTKTIDPRGVATEMEYDSLQRLTKVTAASVIIGSNSGGLQALNLITETKYGLTAKVTLAGGNGTSSAGDNCGGLAFGFNFKPTRVIDSRLFETRTTYTKAYRPARINAQIDGNDYALTTFGYDDVGNKTSSTVYRGLASATSQIGNNGKTTVITYDALNRPLSVTDGDPNPNGLHTVISTNYTSTTAYRVTDPLNRATETDFDAAGRPVKVWSPDPLTGLINRAATNVATGSPVTETVYDANGNVIATINPLGNRWDFTYDARNRKIQEQQPQVADATNPTLPVNSRPTASTEYDQANNVTRNTDARGVISEPEYDNAYRVIKATSAVGTAVATVVESTYDQGSNILAVKDPNGNFTRNQYDALGRLTRTATNPVTGNPSVDLSTPLTGDIVVTNLYDNGNNLVKVTDGKDQHTGFEYDGLNRKTKTIWDTDGDPLTDSTHERIEVSSYDALLQIGRTDPKNQVTSFIYDALFRLTDVAYTGRATDDRTMVYDLVGNLLSVTYPNETAANQTIRGCTQAYDRLNRATSETSNGVTHTTTYDKAGNTLLQTYGQTNRALACTYDALNRLLTCSEAIGAATPRITTYAYDHNGNTTRKTLPNLTYTDKTYDSLNRVAVITNLRPDTTVIQSTQMTYDVAGNVTQTIESSASTVVTGGTMTTANVYDKTYRLLTETRTDTGQSPTETKITGYGYDKANNRSSKSVTINGGTAQVTTYNYGGIASGYNSNQLISYNRPATGQTVTFTYDANGNRATRIIGANTDTYGYDYDNRLVSLAFQTGANPAKLGNYAYIYDHRTRRVNRNESGASGSNTLCVFSGGLSVQEHTTAISASPTVEYVRGSDYGGGVGGVLYTLRSGVPSFNYYNSRGDVLAKTDSTGATTWQANYEAFGTRTAENGTNNDRQKANTKDEDPTGLLNEGMRYRDLEAGIFITRDPAGFVDGPNVYTYVRQNPWTMFDPLGLAEENVHITKWRNKSENATNPFSWAGATTMLICECLNPFRSDSNIRKGGDEMNKNMAVARKNLKEAPPVVRQLGQFTLGFGSVNPVTAMNGAGELTESVKANGFVGTGKQVVKSTLTHAWDNPFEFAGNVSVPSLLAGKTGRSGTLTKSEFSELQIIADKYGTTIDVVGSRANGKGRNINLPYLPVGKGKATRSDIDTRVDTTHPEASALIDDVNKVSGGAGNASTKHSTADRPTYPPFIRIEPTKKSKEE